MVDENRRKGSPLNRILTPRILWSVTLALLTTGCAPQSPEALNAGPETRIIRTPAGVAEVVIPDRVRREIVPASADQVLRALLIRYQALGLEPDWLEPDKGIVRNHADRPAGGAWGPEAELLLPLRKNINDGRLRQ